VDQICAEIETPYVGVQEKGSRSAEGCPFAQPTRGLAHFVSYEPITGGIGGGGTDIGAFYNVVLN